MTLYKRFRLPAFCLTALICLALARTAHADDLVRVASAADRLWLDAQGVKILRVYKHFPWVLVQSDANAKATPAWRRTAARRGMRPAANIRVHLAAQPNDPLFSNQSEFNTAVADADMHWLQAWDLIHDNTNAIVAVIDTGLDVSHPDLQANLWHNPSEFSGLAGHDDDGNGLVDDVYGWNFAQNNADLSESVVHGTFVSGLIAAEGDNSVGVAGGCWRARLMILKCFITNDSVLSDLIAAMDYALSYPEVRVINASWGDLAAEYTPDELAALQEAVHIVTQSGVLMVAAAGNNGVDCDVNPFYPAAYPEVLSVASIDANGAKSSFSNYGAVIDVSAMGGTGVYSTKRSSDGFYGTTGVGTSYATPQVAALAALVFALRPTATPAQVQNWITSNARKTTAWNGVAIRGGLINARAALDNVLRNDVRHWSVYP